MSCNGCRVLRKGCSESCLLRPCLQWIESPESQGHATVFVAKFFGRAGLMSFISAVPESQRPALFQSLLFEACGRTINPVNGAVGLLWSGNWHLCQAAMETVLRGGTLWPIPELLAGDAALIPSSVEVSEAEVTCTDMWKVRDPSLATSRFSNSRSKSSPKRKKLKPTDLDLHLMMPNPKRVAEKLVLNKSEVMRPGTPSMNSEESVTTTCYEGYGCERVVEEQKVLNLFV